MQFFGGAQVFFPEAIQTLWLQGEWCFAGKSWNAFLLKACALLDGIDASVVNALLFFSIVDGEHDFDIVIVRPRASSLGDFSVIVAR